MRLTRFEQKIMFAITAVAITPLLAAVILGRGALREAYQVGVNPKVHGQLEEGLALYREHLVSLRAYAERTADAVASDWQLRKLLEVGEPASLREYLDERLDAYTNVAAVSVRGADGTVRVRVERADRQDPDRMRVLTRQRELEPPVLGSVEVTVATPAAPFLAYRRAGELEEVYRRLRESGDFVSNYYLAVFALFLLSVIAVAMGLGFVLSRRVTRRVVDLAEATERVGSGDLSVEVPTDAKDEIGELTRAFNDMVRDLRDSRERIAYLQRIGAWQEFARRLAHEIKNPLTPIQLAAQEMLRSYRGDDPAYAAKLSDACDIIQEEVATLRRLVGEFRDFAKLPEARLAEAELADVIHDSERAIPAIFEDVGLEVGTDVTVRCETDDSPMPVRVDAMMLKRCVDNLLRNSLQALRDHPPEGGGTLLLRASRSGSRAFIEVSDNGPGIPEALRERVFDPYYTSKQDGTGLGLAIVKKVVLEHGGTVVCQEVPGGGARFLIELPLEGTRPPPTSRGSEARDSAQG